MVILVFVVDTSASMNQRTSLGTTLLDVAKNAVETFIKIRQRDQASRTDRYMLMTFDEAPATIKAGWRENQAIFMNELRNLQATGLSKLGTVLKESFDLLNLYRLQSGIDNYGLGRNPFYLDPAMVICITDGSRLTTSSDVEEELHLPMHSNLPGSELTKEPFRWDQRLFSLVLKMAGCRGNSQPKPGIMAVTSEATISAMCEVTGGKCYKCSSSKSLGQALESLTQKIQFGVVVNFDKIGGPELVPPPPPEAQKNPESKNMRDTDSPTPPLQLEVPNHISNNFDVEEEELDKINVENHRAIKTEGLCSSGPSPPGTSPRGDSLAVNHCQLPEDANTTSCLSRSTTASPIPPSAQNTAWMSCCKMIYVKTNPKLNTPVGFWPIPETFWPDPSLSSLPARDSHPSVYFSCVDVDPQVLDNLPFDKYELEPSPLTQYILERKSPSTCWQTFICNSGRRNGESSQLGSPFGYLKASTNLQTVNLFVMPYNYPVLFPLVDELVKVHKMKPIPKWKQAFETYLESMPSYYAGPLRNAFRRMGIPTSIIPDHMDGSLSFTILNYLKKIKQQGKIEAERLVVLVSQNLSRESQGRVKPSGVQIPELPATEKKDKSKNDKMKSSDIDIPSSESLIRENVTRSYKNPFDIKRVELLDQLSRMKINFFHMAATTTRLQDEDSRHTIAIADMGNFQEVLRHTNQLREIDPGQNRVHMFGNPFKLAKDQRVMIDEADVNEAMAGPPSRKRSIDNRPGSPRDKRKRPDTPPVKWPTSINTQPPQPIQIQQQKQPPTQQNIKPAIVINKNNTLINDVKPNNVVKQRKRKVSEDIFDKGTDTGVRPAKVVRHTINPQLKKLQQLHQNKSSISTNNTDKEHPSSDISSILRNSITSQERTDKNALILTGEARKIKTKVVNYSHGERLLGSDGESSGSSKESSPVMVSKQQLLREAHEGNVRVRRLVSRTLRRHKKVDDAVIAEVANLHGPPEIQCTYLVDIITEALQFKRHSLVLKLKSHMELLRNSSVALNTEHYTHSCLSKR